MIGTPALGIIPSGNRAFIGSFNRFDPDAQNYFSRLASAGSGTDFKSAINQFIVGAKSDGIWDKLTELYLLAGVSNLDGCLVKLKHAGTSLLTNYNFVSGDYVASGSSAGLVGDGTTKRITTGVNLTNAGNVSLSAYLSVADSLTGSRCYIGGQLLPNSSSILGQLDAGTKHAFSCSNPADVTNYAGVVAARANGFYSGSARSLSDREVYRNGTSIGTNTNLSSAFSGNVPIGLFASEGATPSLYTNARISFAHIGTGLSDAEAALLSTRVNALMTAIGCNVY